MSGSNHAWYRCVQDQLGSTRVKLCMMKPDANFSGYVWLRPWQLKSMAQKRNSKSEQCS